MKQLSHIALRYVQIKLRSPAPRTLKRHCHVAFGRARRDGTPSVDLVIREGAFEYVKTSQIPARHFRSCEIIYGLIEDGGG